MINNKFFIAIFLCIGLSSHTSFTAEQPQTGWRGLASNAYNSAYNTAASLWKGTTQKLSQATNYAASFIPQSVKNAINSWSTQKKIVVATAIIGALALIYNKDVVMQMASDAYDRKLTGTYYAPPGSLDDQRTWSRVAVEGFTKIPYTTNAPSNAEIATAAGVTGAVVAGLVGLGKAEQDSERKQVELERKQVENIKNLAIKNMNEMLEDMPNMSIEQKIAFVDRRLKVLEDHYDDSSKKRTKYQHRFEYIPEKMGLLEVRANLIEIKNTEGQKVD